MSRHTVNFFWMGDDFQFLNRLTILSHLNVGHKVAVWLHGNPPNSKYWISDIPEIIVRDANKIINVNRFLGKIARGLKKKRYRVVSALWRFTFLFKFGGLYCDTDAIAIKEFPHQEWIIASDREDYFSIGVIKCPARHAALNYCMRNWSAKWGNVWVFTDAMRIYNLGLTNPIEAFYPITCLQHNVYNNRYKTSIMLRAGEIPDSYSIHYYGNRTQGLNIDQEMIDKYPESVIYKLSKHTFKEYSYTNKES